MDVWTFQRNAAKYNNTINFGRRYKAEAILCDRGSRKIEHYAPARQPLMPSCCVVSACISVDTISVAVFNQESSFYTQTFISHVGLERRKSSAVHARLGGSKRPDYSGFLVHASELRVRDRISWKVFEISI